MVFEEVSTVADHLGPFRVCIHDDEKHGSLKVAGIVNMHTLPRFTWPFPWV